ncbi:MAG: hypothetical protein COV44_10950 [Deltaproteobacteria bacterium CG11_big_fil_rev_8_21_14_0_20_45_16]|nr:MAG: hypothetical protein COV44_10950 [Deltaproteobacteria bacterium CG11_big_fil_rev_8_21_14_0_20_45_16]
MKTRIRLSLLISVIALSACGSTEPSISLDTTLNKKSSKDKGSTAQAPEDLGSQLKPIRDQSSPVSQSNGQVGIVKSLEQLSSQDREGPIASVLTPSLAEPSESDPLIEPKLLRNIDVVFDRQASPYIIDRPWIIGDHARISVESGVKIQFLKNGRFIVGMTDATNSSCTESGNLSFGSLKGGNLDYIEVTAEKSLESTLIDFRCVADPDHNFLDYVRFSDLVGTDFSATIRVGDAAHIERLNHLDFENCKGSNLEIFGIAKHLQGIYYAGHPLPSLKLSPLSLASVTPASISDYSQPVRIELLPGYFDVEGKIEFVRINGAYVSSGHLEKLLRDTPEVHELILNAGVNIEFDGSESFILGRKQILILGTRESPVVFSGKNWPARQVDPKTLLEILNNVDLDKRNLSLVGLEQAGELVYKGHANEEPATTTVRTLQKQIEWRLGRVSDQGELRFLREAEEKLERLLALFETRVSTWKGIRVFGRFEPASAEVSNLKIMDAEVALVLSQKQVGVFKEFSGIAVEDCVCAFGNSPLGDLFCPAGSSQQLESIIDGLSK